MKTIYLSPTVVVGTVIPNGLLMVSNNLKLLYNKNGENPNKGV